MANIKFFLRGRSNPRTLYVRLYRGRSLDIQCSTELLVDSQFWDSHLGAYRKGSNPRLIERQIIIDKLKLKLIDAYNDAMIAGELIDSVWLSGVIASAFNRAGGQAAPGMFIQFCNWWLNHKSPEWRSGETKGLSNRAKQQYHLFTKLWLEFREGIDCSVREIGHSLISEFYYHMINEEDYSIATAKRMVGRAKFFIARAEMSGVEVAPDYREIVYSGPKADPLKPYLNGQEIQAVYSLDLSHDEKLDRIRDCAIIGLWTGLRISDFNKRLDIDNIDEDYISIQTQKTGAWVTVPLHPHVRAVIRKNFGLLPRRYNNAYFNAGIKTICMLAGIDAVIPGKKFDAAVGRAVLGRYKKYELITSHTCRRSFASNLYGRVPNHVLADLGGWANEKIMLHYVKRTKAESAEVLKKLWDKNI